MWSSVFALLALAITVPIGDTSSFYQCTTRNAPCTKCFTRTPVSKPQLQPHCIPGFSLFGEDQKETCDFECAAGVPKLWECGLKDHLCRPCFPKGTGVDECLTDAVHATFDACAIADSCTTSNSAGIYCDPQAAQCKSCLGQQCPKNIPEKYLFQTMEECQLADCGAAPSATEATPKRTSLIDNAIKTSQPAELSTGFTASVSTTKPVASTQEVTLTTSPTTEAPRDNSSPTTEEAENTTEAVRMKREVEQEVSTSNPTSDNQTSTTGTTDVAMVKREATEGSTPNDTTTAPYSRPKREVTRNETESTTESMEARDKREADDSTHTTRQVTEDDTWGTTTRAAPKKREVSAAETTSDGNATTAAASTTASAPIRMKRQPIRSG